VGDRFLQILLAEGLIKVLPEASTEARFILHLTAVELRRTQEAFDNLRHPLVFLCPDAGMQIKRWSTANFVTLAQALQ
jgi:ADP-heptose:LPS heptosyltransferase